MKKPNPFWCAVLLSLLVAGPPAGQAEEDLKARSLRGITAFQLIVERPTEDAVKAGLSEEGIRGQVTALFRAALPQVSLEGENAPALYVRIVLHKRQKEDLYYGTINVSVDRPVLILSPGGDFPAFSQVWESTLVFSGRDPVLGTFELLPRLIQLLVADFKKANPDGRH